MPDTNPAASSPRRRVVITGLGCVTSLGNDVDQVFADVCAGKSGIGPITRFDTADFDVKFAGQVPDFEPQHMSKRDAKKVDRFAMYAVEAAGDAIAQSGIDFEKEDLWRCGTIIGSGIGGLEELENSHRRLVEKGPSKVSPFTVPKMMCNAGCGNVSIHFGLRGPNHSIATACASAGHAIGDACEAIRHGIADVIITGGSEAAVTPLGLACFCSLRALSKRNEEPTLASRPFDADRDGFVLAEGCGILVLESLEHAQARGATIIAELLGWGQSADGSHITAPLEDGSGAGHAMQLALDDAGLTPQDVSDINAHGTSTPLGDKAETTAVKRIFGDHAASVPVSSTKGVTGHPLGAAGGIEAVLCVKAVTEGVMPPTVNLTTPDPDCDLDYVPGTARQTQVDVAMSNSFGFGGHNVSLIVGKPRD